MGKKYVSATDSLRPGQLDNLMKGIKDSKPEGYGSVKVIPGFLGKWDTRSIVSAVDRGCRLPNNLEEGIIDEN